MFCLKILRKNVIAMTIKKQYFYLPENRSMAILSQFIPVDNWISVPGYLISITTADGVLELEFGAVESVKLLADALQELLNSTEKKDISMKAFMVEDQF